MLALSGSGCISSFTIIIFKIRRAFKIAARKGSWIALLISKDLTVSTNWVANWRRSYISSLTSPTLNKLRAEWIAHRIITEISVITKLISYSFWVSTNGKASSWNVKISPRAIPFWTSIWAISQTSCCMKGQRMIWIPVITSLCNDSSVSAYRITKWGSICLLIAFPTSCYSMTS